MSNRYNFLRKQFKNEIRFGKCYCVLSGLKITDKQDLSIDHYYPKSLDENGNTYNIKNLFPSIRIINNLKSNLIPCVWEEEKFDILYHAAQNYRLNDHDYKIVVNAIKNIEYYQINPCLFCINNIKCKRK